MSLALACPTERPRIEPRIEARIALQRGSTVSGAADPRPSWLSGPRAVRSTFVDPLRIRVIPLSSTEQSWIADINGCAVGCVSLGDAGAGSADLRLVAVESEYRGLGLGRRLVHEALAFARRTGYQEVQIGLDGGSLGSAPWLTSLGFVPDPSAGSSVSTTGAVHASGGLFRITLATC